MRSSGGGIAGFTLAASLAQYPDIHIELYEAASQFGEIGAGIGMGWRARTLMERIGLKDEADAIGGPISSNPGTPPSFSFSCIPC